jgi:hypothetical protein
MSYTTAPSSATVIPFNNPQAAWQRPRLVEIHYPTRISDIRDRDNWIKAMMLDQCLTERARLILSRLALHLNLKTGRCDPSEGLLGIEVSIPGTPHNVERVVRRALAAAEERGWIRRTHRHGGNTKRQSQTNQYKLTVPDDATTGPLSPVVRCDDRTNRRERPDSRVPDNRTVQSKTTGLYSPPNSEEENSEENSEENGELENSELGAMDSNLEFDKEGKEGKQARQADSLSNSPTQPLPPHPPNSARPPPQPKPESGGLAAALERLGHGIRSNGGDRLTIAGSSISGKGVS